MSTFIYDNNSGFFQSHDTISFYHSKIGVIFYIFLGHFSTLHIASNTALYGIMLLIKFFISIMQFLKTQCITNVIVLFCTELVTLIQFQLPLIFRNKPMLQCSLTKQTL